MALEHVQVVDNKGVHLPPTAETGELERVEDFFALDLVRGLPTKRAANQTSSQTRKKQRVQHCICASLCGAYPYAYVRPVTFFAPQQRVHGGGCAAVWSMRAPYVRPVTFAPQRGCTDAALLKINTVGGWCTYKSGLDLRGVAVGILPPSAVKLWVHAFRPAQDR